ncbi:Glycosyltransferase AglJ [uncultured archaeon]|nr:Glycosyltransferase AglJ [uncultured archaeon]
MAIPSQSKPLKMVSILIPVYNEATTLNQCLDNVLQQELPLGLAKEIIIVESNSTDGSRELVKAFYEKSQEGRSSPQTEIKLILQECPQGKGFAIREALSQASGDIIIIQDADLEYDVADYPELLRPILEGHAHFVLGSRHLSAGSWKVRQFERGTFTANFMNIGAVFFHTFFNWLYGVELTDPTTMYKVFRIECIQGIKFECSRFDFDWELVAKLIRLGFIPIEIPISYKSRGFSEGKKISLTKDPLLWVRAIIKYRLTPIERTL